MTALLLDTSAYSAAMRGHPQIATWLRRAQKVCVNAVVIGELLAGFCKGSRQRENQDVLDQFLQTPRVRVIALDAETAKRYAVLHDHLRRAGKPIATNDLWIAASALEHGLTLLTTDSDFLKVPGIIVQCYGPA